MIDFLRKMLNQKENLKRKILKLFSDNNLSGSFFIDEKDEDFIVTLKINKENTNETNTPRNKRVHRNSKT